METGNARVGSGGSAVTRPKAGQIVDPATPLLTPADLGDLIVEADVDETYATQISAGQPAVLKLVGKSGTRNRHVDFVSRQVDVGTGGLSDRSAAGASAAGCACSSRHGPRSAIATSSAGRRKSVSRGTACRSPP
jgi:hypothetical protein